MARKNQRPLGDGLPIDTDVVFPVPNDGKNASPIRKAGVEEAFVPER